ncbi:DUF3710 domain-containing protein [Varibaculum cambriense]|uniref:DUF3710 domain-containing protein n=1 Tax=Varibaculum cambriense TaxID=184870 RepID=UPI0009DBC03D|nr:DUF3710 domain-containing protein [Varibaculum cambriense]MDU5316767.1 DUF3710 domain-containing protein [Varibaculum cambriense]MDU5614982.1 DUF3710 domain-containing protein [Varibaculum cambriense]
MRLFPSRRKRIAPEESLPLAADMDTPGQPGEAANSAEYAAGELAPAPGEGEVVSNAQISKQQGPYNEGESPAGSEFLDLGVLRIPMIAGLQILPVQDGSGNILALEVVSGTAQMQLAAFAMQRSGGLWDEIRQELADQLKAEEYQIFPLPGPFGEAVLARPIPEGKSAIEGAMPLLLWGIEGDRWLLRVILRGQAAEEESAREGLLAVLHGMEVVRGNEAYVPGETLPIELSADLIEQLGMGE